MPGNVRTKNISYDDDDFYDEDEYYDENDDEYEDGVYYAEPVQPQYAPKAAKKQTQANSARGNDKKGKYKLLLSKGLSARINPCKFPSILRVGDHKSMT